MKLGTVGPQYDTVPHDACRVATPEEQAGIDASAERARLRAIRADFDRWAERVARKIRDER